MLEGDLTEIALLMGYRSRHDTSFVGMKIDIGTEMQLVKMAATSEFVRNIDATKIADLRQLLDGMMRELDKASETINAVTVFETLKADHA